MAPIDNVGNFSIETFSEIISVGVSSKLIYEGSICDSYPCLNDGICVDLLNQTSSGNGRAYKCVCGDMFQGRDCELRIPPSNCSASSYPCMPFEPLCLPPSIRCPPMLSQSNCSFNPCLNGGVCLLIPNHNHQTSPHQRCICPTAFRGVLCELRISLNSTSSFLPKNLISTSISNANHSEWSVLQSIFFFAALIILAATLLVLCYAKYAHFPAIFGRVNEYEVGNQYFLEDDLFGCDDEELIGGVQMFRGSANQSMSDLSQQCFMEMKTKPSFMKVSSTAESFITYDAKKLTGGPHDQHLSASDGQGPSTPVYI